MADSADTSQLRTVLGKGNREKEARKNKELNLNRSRVPIKANAVRWTQLNSLSFSSFLSFFPSWSFLALRFSLFTLDSSFLLLLCFFYFLLLVTLQEVFSLLWTQAAFLHNESNRVLKYSINCHTRTQVFFYFFSLSFFSTGV